MLVTQGNSEDAAIFAQIFFDAVRRGPKPYTQAQREAWVRQVPETKAFAMRLNTQYIAKAGVPERPQGFMTLRRDGYIDFAHILHEARGMGVFRALYGAIEQKARERALDRLSTHASLMAQPAFQAVGFAVMHHEEVERNGQLLARALMEKRLT